jgi:hypothetical protein
MKQEEQEQSPVNPLKRKTASNQSHKSKTTVTTTNGSDGVTNKSTVTTNLYGWGISSSLSPNTNITTTEFNMGVDDGKSIEKIDQPLVKRVISDAIDKFSNKDETPTVNLITNEDTKGSNKVIEYIIAINFDKETRFNTLKLAELQCIHPSIGYTPMEIKYDLKTDTMQLTITVPSLTNEVWVETISYIQHQVSPLLFYNDDCEVGPNGNNKNESIFRNKKRVKYNDGSSVSTKNGGK